MVSFFEILVMLRLVSFLDALLEMFVLLILRVVFNDAIEANVSFLNKAIAND